MEKLLAALPNLHSKSLNKKLAETGTLKWNGFEPTDWGDYFSRSGKHMPEVTHILPYNNRLIGIEVEIENVKQGFNANDPWYIGYLWQHESDGSLRNNGAEFISRPVSGVHAVRAVECLYKYLDRIKATASPRTSVHVHVNMRDSTWGQLINLVMIYMTFERVLYDFVGNERDKNNFCIPLYSYPPTFSFLENLFSFKGTAVANWLRYTGLNFAALTKNGNGKGGYGTVEFRHFSGSKDVDKVITWIALILQMVKVSEQYTTAELLQILANRTAEHTTHMIFKEYANLFKDKPLQAMIEEGQADLTLALHRMTTPPYHYSEESAMFLAVRGKKL